MNYGKNKSYRTYKSYNPEHPESGSREFCPISCSHYDCRHKNGTGCKKTTVWIDRNGNCRDYEAKPKKTDRNR